MTNTDISQYRESTEDSITYGCNHCGQYVRNLIDHRKAFHPDLAQRDNQRVLNPKGRGIAGRVLPVLTIGTLALGASGCITNPVHERGVIVGKEADAYIVSPVNDPQSLRRVYGPFVDTSSYQIGDTLYAEDINDITQGKPNKMKGGNQ